MELQELFNSPDIRAVETRIITLVRQNMKCRYGHGDYKMAISELLKVRKRLLDSTFQMDDNYKSLLAGFNEALKVRLTKMREKAIAMYEAVKAVGDGQDNMEVTGRCYLGYEYPSSHPVQTDWAKKIWQVLNNSLDDYMPLYEDALGLTFYIGFHSQPDSLNQLLWLNEERDNWNEHLDKDMTKDMNILYAFYNLWCNLDFSIFDLLWVRDFNIEITIENDYDTLPENYIVQDIDWD